MAELTPETQLLNPKTISKKQDPEGRHILAETIIGARAEARAVEQQIASNKYRVGATQTEIENTDQVIQQTNTELEQQTNKIWVRLKAKLGIRDQKVESLKKGLEAEMQKDQTLQEALEKTNRELELAGQRQAEIPDPKKLLEAYYEKVQTLPLSNEEKREVLKPEVLANLSMEEYIALWRRLNPYFLTHVTRQGFRDHTGNDVMVNHLSGYQEFVNGFVDVMQNGRKIFPPLARVGLINRDETTVKSFLEHFLSDATSADEAMEKFHTFLNFSLAAAPTYPDITATHFGAQVVLDSYYGGEGDNEAFFVFPADVLASQYAYAFNGWEKDFTQPQSEDKWNDVFVWTDPDNPGAPVDSGIVFLPENTPVDPETGSKFASEIKVIDGKEQRVLIENEPLIEAFVEWGKGIDSQSPLRQIYDAYVEERHYYTQMDLQKRCLETFVQEVQKLGIPEDSSYRIAGKVMSMMYGHSSLNVESLRGLMNSTCAGFKRAERAIPAKQYWEGLFLKNPQIRPKHVVYYNGSPTTAIYRFQETNNIGRAETSKTEGGLLGFDDHHVGDMKNDPRSNLGYDELMEKARKITQAHFNHQT